MFARLLRNALCAAGLLAAVALASLYAQEQPPQPAAPGKPAEKPAVPPAPKTYEEELWYRILEKDDPIGYGHHTIAKTTFKGQPALRLLYEEEMRPRKLLDAETSARLSTITNYDYEFIEGEMGAFKGEEEKRYSLRVSQEHLFLVTAQGNFDADWTTKDAGLECMLGKWLSKKGLVEGKRWQFQHFTGLAEPPTETWEIEVREHATRSFADESVQGWSCRATGRRGDKPIDRIYFVDENGRILEMREGDVTRIFVRTEEAAKVGQRFELAARGRRDPFRVAMTPKDKLKVGDPADAPGTNAPQKSRPMPEAEIQRLLQAARENVESMREAKKKYAADPNRLQQSLEKSYNDVLYVWQEFQDKVKIKNDGHRIAIGKLKAEAEELWSGLERLVAQVDKIHKEADEMFGQAQYPPIEAKRAEAESIAKRPELAGTRYAPQVELLYEKVRRLAERAKLRIEFEGKKPKITGIIYHLVPREVPFRMGVELLGDRISVESNLRVSSSSSTCFLSVAGQDQVKAEGEDLSAELRVKRIERGAVLFDYRGEEIRVEMGRQS
ncbi:MAG: hypothetical protein HZA54_12690 [Planctomycetes bacterium]|nr:hypothetical protein [Planctomycetota bacterium]